MHTHKRFTSFGLLAIVAAVGLAGCSTSAEYKTAGPLPPVSKEDRFPIMVKGGKAYTQKCGYWPTDLSGDFYNRSYPTFGCSTQSNLAAMIAKPKDVHHMRKSTPSDGARRAAVLDKFNKGESLGASSSQGASTSTGTTN